MTVMRHTAPHGLGVIDQLGDPTGCLWDQRAPPDCGVSLKRAQGPGSQVGLPGGWLRTLLPRDHLGTCSPCFLSHHYYHVIFVVTSLE